MDVSSRLFKNKRILILESTSEEESTIIDGVVGKSVRLDEDLVIAEVRGVVKLSSNLTHYISLEVATDGKA